MTGTTLRATKGSALTSTEGDNNWKYRIPYVVTKSAAANTVTADEGSIYAVDASGGAVTITLDTDHVSDGWAITIKKTDSSANAVTIDTEGSETIDGASTATLSSQYDSITVASDGTNWQTVHKTEEFPTEQVMILKDEKASGTDGGSAAPGDNTRTLNTETKNTIAGGGLVYTLDYDAQTANFTVGQTLTGGTSSATGTIIADSDSGATGTLKLINISGTFQNDETITDEGTGSATSDGTPSANNQFYLPIGTYLTRGAAVAVDVNANQIYIYNDTDTAVESDTLGVTAFSNGSFTGSTQSTATLSGDITITAAKLFTLHHYCASNQSGDGFGKGHSGQSFNNVYAELEIRKIA